MLDYLSGAGQELRSEFISLYWILILPLVLFLLTVELLKNETPNLKELFRRILISLLLLYSFSWTIEALATVGDAITEKINGLEKLADVLKNLGPNYHGSNSWFNMRETTIYILNLCAYIIAYLGFFVATILTHFVWTILYVCSPLMILAYVGQATSFVTASLYRGLIHVILWKILWSILGVLLLKLAMNPQVTGLDDYLMSIVVNLCIGLSMLLVPITTKSLIGEGMSSVATTLALAPSVAAVGAIKLSANQFGRKTFEKAQNAAQFAARPLSNQFKGRYEQMKSWVTPVATQAKAYRRRYENLGRMIFPEKENHAKERKNEA